jgi:nucleoside-diphosphate-sugar epimerase
MSRLFCFGLGYSAAALARRLKARGWQVAGTAREPEACAARAAEGYDMRLFARGTPLADARAALAGATHVLLSVPPDAMGDPVLALCGAALPTPDLQWVGYLSSTAIYGDRGGGAVDEETPPAPTGPRGEARLAAEDGWCALARSAGLPLHRFRLAGIYGPGRSALDLVRQGRALRVAKPGHLFSRIHVEDLASVLCASMARPAAGAIYNVCDDEPASQSDVLAFAASLLGVPPPPEIPFDVAPLSPAARAFYAENKRVGNARLKRELGVRLAYPDYRAGLAAILAAERVSGPGAGSR